MSNAVVVREDESLPPPATIPSSAEDLIRTAIERNVPVETMERLLAMRRELQAEAARTAYFEALSAFQKECPQISKRRIVMQKDGRAVRYKYAALSDIVAQVAPLLEKHGFSHTENSQVEPGWVTGVCTVHHRLGHNEQSSFKVPTDTASFMNAPQQYASALTFTKRYAFCDALGILTSDEDDDAQTAVQKAQAAGPPSEEDKIRIARKKISDTLWKRFPGRKLLQQHLWDENLMPLDVRVETASLEVLEKVIAKL